MSKNVVSVDKSSSVLEAAKLMDKHNISSLLVVENKKPVGIITERDMVRKVILNNLDLNSRVEKVMTSPVISIEADEDITKAAEILINKKIRRLPVVKDKKLVGIITETDISRSSPKALEEFSSSIEKIERFLKDL
jgi:CBS domain-containing protein